jgi:hypothetical protein
MIEESARQLRAEDLVRALKNATGKWGSRASPAQPRGVLWRLHLRLRAALRTGARVQRARLCSLSSFLPWWHRPPCKRASPVLS